MTQRDSVDAVEIQKRILHAFTYGNQGRWEEAERLQVQVMETSKLKLGAVHPSTPHNWHEQPYLHLGGPRPSCRGYQLDGVLS